MPQARFTGTFERVAVTVFVAALSIGAAAAQAFHDRQPNGPTFDCKAPHLTHVERTVCADHVLPGLDATLGDAYSEYLFATDDMRATAQAEATWLGRRDRCASVPCLRAAYNSRIAALNRAAQSVFARRTVLPATGKASLLVRFEIIAGVRCLASIIPIDLGDGVTSYRAEGCPTCDPAKLIIFHPEGATYRIIFREDSCYVSGLFSGVQQSRSHGLRDIATFSRSSAVDHERTLFGFDGRTYRQIGEAYSHFYNGKHQVTFFERSPS